MVVGILDYFLWREC